MTLIFSFVFRHQVCTNRVPQTLQLFPRGLYRSLGTGTFRGRRNENECANNKLLIKPKRYVYSECFDS